MGLGKLHMLLLVAAVVAADQLTKYWIMTTFPLGSSLPVIPDFFNLVHVHNTGGAFGLLAGDNIQWRRIFFIAVTLVALGALTLLYYNSRGKGWLFDVSLGLIAGGAIGNNLFDRWRFGSVVDFLEFYVNSFHWPAFNVADSAITTGVGLFLLASLRQRQ